MSFAEAEDYLTGAKDRVRDLWQCTRLLMYTNVAVMGGAKGKSPESIMKLPWDNDGREEKKITEDELNKMRAIAKCVADKINKQHERSDSKIKA